MKIVAVSPHRDDAAFSCGLSLGLCAQANRRVEVLNLFTVSEYAPFADPPWTVERISEIRKDEDAKAREVIGGWLTFLDLGMHDAPLRFDIPPAMTLDDPLGRDVYAREVATLAETILPLVAEASLVLVPLAFGGHIDHRIARDATIRCTSLDNLAFYEDLPYAARLAEDQKAIALRSLADATNGTFFRRVLLPGTALLQSKRELVGCYRSQVNDCTMDQIISYGEALGGEIVYAGAAAHGILEGLVSSADSQAAVL